MHALYKKESLRDTICNILECYRNIHTGESKVEYNRDLTVYEREQYARDVRIQELTSLLYLYRNIYLKFIFP